MVAIMNDDNDNYDLDAVRPTVVEEKRAVKKPSIKIKKRKSATTHGDDDCKDDAETSSAKKSSKKSRKTSENDMIAVDSDADDNRDDESAPPKTDKKEKRSKKDKKEKKSKKPRKTIEEAVAALTGTSGTSATATSAKKSNEFGVWIGNLSFSTTAEQVRDFFKDCGEIVRLHLPVNAATTAGPKGIFKNKGFAYVDFADAAGLEKGLALSEQPLLDRNVLIKRAVDFNTTGKLPRSTKTATYSHYDVNDALGLPHVKKTDGGGSASNNAATSTKVFVGNLPFTATRQEVKELFAPLGRVITVRLAQFQDEPKALSTKDPNAATDKSEPRCKGYAHVIFAESSAALDAVAQSKQKTGPGFMLGGKRLRVELGKTPDVAPAVKRKREERVVVEGEVRGVPRGANTKIVFGEE